MDALLAFEKWETLVVDDVYFNQNARTLMLSAHLPFLIHLKVLELEIQKYLGAEDVRASSAISDVIRNFCEDWKISVFSPYYRQNQRQFEEKIIKVQSKHLKYWSWPVRQKVFDANSI